MYAMMYVLCSMYLCFEQWKECPFRFLYSEAKDKFHACRTIIYILILILIHRTKLNNTQNEVESEYCALPTKYTQKKVCVLTSRFSGLMSRWTMLRVWRYLMALARLKSMPLASLSVYLLDDVMASNRSPPWCKWTVHGQNEQKGRITKTNLTQETKWWAFYSCL